MRPLDRIKGTSARETVISTARDAHTKDQISWDTNKEHLSPYNYMDWIQELSDSIGITLLEYVIQLASTD